MPVDSGPPPDGSAIEICKTPKCVAPSCGVTLPKTCGPNEDQDCCTSYIVPGGTFNRDNNPALPATVSRFALDAYEVTVGRFRTFLSQYPSSKPALGAGQHPKLGKETGWQSEWGPFLPPTSDSFNGRLSDCTAPKAWTTESAQNENFPIACITWYFAFAFCAWDHGRLPTEAEWSFAAVGGDEQRVYPWSQPPTDETIGDQNGSFDCASRDECPFLLSLIPVGSKPRGNGRWGHSDLVGNLWEWTLDSVKRCVPCGCDECPACIDCTNAVPNFPHAYRIIHGGGFETSVDRLKAADARQGYMSNYDDFSFATTVGFRCARDPE